MFCTRLANGGLFPTGDPIVPFVISPRFECLNKLTHTHTSCSLSALVRRRLHIRVHTCGSTPSGQCDSLSNSSSPFISSTVVLDCLADRGRSPYGLVVPPVGVSDMDPLWSLRWPLQSGPYDTIKWFKNQRNGYQQKMDPQKTKRIIIIIPCI